jgi:hypothetical protein
MDSKRWKSLNKRLFKGNLNYKFLSIKQYKSLPNPKTALSTIPTSELNNFKHLFSSSPNFEVVHTQPILAISRSSKFFPGFSVQTSRGIIRSRVRTHYSQLFFKTQFFKNRNYFSRELISAHKGPLSSIRLSKLLSLPLPKHLVRLLIHRLTVVLTRDERIRSYRDIKSKPSQNLFNLPADSAVRVSPLPGNVNSHRSSKQQFSLVDSKLLRTTTLLPKTFIESYISQNYLSKRGSMRRIIHSLSTDLSVFMDKYTYISESMLQHPKPSSLLLLPWVTNWTYLIQTYSSFLSLPRLNLYLLLKKSQKVEVKHFIRLRFKAHRLFVVLEDKAKQRTHLFTSTGLFLKYFKQRKALKKSKSLRFLMMRFFRKVLLVLGLKSVGLVTRGIPVHLDSLITTLFKPLSHPFTNPLTGKLINEVSEGKKSTQNISINSILFSYPRPNIQQKVRKRGRVKRKIRRKIVRTSNLID